ncbi:hypothetical protein HL653_23585 [Sphingomonas sp. AP4-R1]|uniref:hypothetical protein n=1 Tax=Sphingomonas sp. AP4-R1 TaxID=2735134 RepID=UPI0014933A88|nr:hypothetical protein [Sphingomonas sp. AP4-R1]QJU60316.1 hypothetical protein HL653_23585 [Sphingomonas sp. AP4-R1]
MEPRLAYAEESELESCLRPDLAQMPWSLDGLIDDLRGIVNEMPWASDWIRRTGPATGGVPLN